MRWCYSMEVSDSSGDDGLQNKKGQVTGNWSIKSNRDAVIITGSTVKREAQGNWPAESYGDIQHDIPRGKINGQPMSSAQFIKLIQPKKKKKNLKDLLEGSLIKALWSLV